jgi:hypothetical protein
VGLVELHRLKKGFSLCLIPQLELVVMIPGWTWS